MPYNSRFQIRWNRRKLFVSAGLSALFLLVGCGGGEGGGFTGGPM